MTPSARIGALKGEAAAAQIPEEDREGVLLARRLCGPGGQDGPDAGTTSAQARDGEWRRSALAREAIPTAVFSPTEYACIGLSEEEARERIGDEHLEVYLLEYVPLEWSVVPARAETPCFLKLLCDTSDDERIVGAHMVGAPPIEPMNAHPHHQGRHSRRGGKLMHTRL